MTFDLTINVATVVSILVTIIGAVIWLVRLEGKADTSRHDIETLSKTLNALEALVTLHQNQFQEYRLQAAKDYISQASVAEIKRDLIDEMGKMERRVEQAINRALTSAKGQ